MGFIPAGKSSGEEGTSSGQWWPRGTIPCVGLAVAGEDGASSCWEGAALGFQGKIYHPLPTVLQKRFFFFSGHPQISENLLKKRKKHPPPRGIPSPRDAWLRATFPRRSQTSSSPPCPGDPPMAQGTGDAAGTGPSCVPPSGAGGKGAAGSGGSGEIVPPRGRAHRWGHQERKRGPHWEPGCAWHRAANSSSPCRR